MQLAHTQRKSRTRPDGWGPIYITANDDVRDLWRRTLVVASHEHADVAGWQVLVECLRRYRRALSKRHPPGWLESIEAQYHKPKPRKGTTKAPPPKPSTYVD